MTMTTLEILEKARGLIAREDAWCKGQAETIGAWPIQRCAARAIDLASDCFYGEGEIAARAVVAASGLTAPSKFSSRFGGIAFLNDTHTHAEVLAWFDRAIARQRTLESLLTSAHPPAEAEKLRTADPVI
jgi:hypothetical protein